MSSPVSVPIRRAIVRLFHADHRSYEEIAALLDVGEATVSRVLRRHRETGSIEPAAPGGGNFSPIAGQVVRLLKAIVEQLPDATVAELTTALVERSGTSTSRSAVLRALQRIGYSRKKSPSSPRSGTRRNTGHAAEHSARS
jgi:transposase